MPTLRRAHILNALGRLSDGIDFNFPRSPERGRPFDWRFDA